MFLNLIFLNHIAKLRAKNLSVVFTYCQALPSLFYSTLFCTILFYSILYSILFPILFYSVLL